ncbi:MAG: transglycosylase SLT domain-containing protein [Arhodomonas sp.]|nr:transglycosylase SLT domain-containing protein [Arhodomonas sp.]
MACALWAPACWSDSSFPDRYDADIRSAAKLYLPGVDWRLWKSQLYAESRLDPDAVSPVGAAGVAQFMPATWREVTAALGWSGVSPHDAQPAIEAGAYYLARLRRNWSAPRPEADRHSLAAASYNAGLGHLLKAQRRCGGPPGYAEIIECLPEVTGRHSEETITYVQRIWRFWTRMLLS